MLRRFEEAPAAFFFERNGPPPPKKLRALTLHRPWPDAIARGPANAPKRIENRGWAPPSTVVGHRIAIHAGLRYEELSYDFPEGWRPPSKANSPTGIVCVATLVGAARRVGPRKVLTRLPGGVSDEERERVRERLQHLDDDPWTIWGAWWWLLDDVVAIDPVPCRGAQGLWVVPETTAAEVRRRVDLARGNAA